jgi:hypothetical protein
MGFLGAGNNRGFPLPPGIRGAAKFSADSTYRTWLTRQWGDLTAPTKSALWIGLNPSTASAYRDDPTCKREWLFTLKWGYNEYRKCNVFDYISTDPRGLTLPNVRPASRDNHKYILKAAEIADTVILACGNVPHPLQMQAASLFAALQERGLRLHCMGVTKSGMPRHPLYLPNTARLQEWSPKY